MLFAVFYLWNCTAVYFLFKCGCIQCRHYQSGVKAVGDKGLGVRFVPCVDVCCVCVTLIMMEEALQMNKQPIIINI